MKEVPKESEDLIAARIANLRSLFPEAFDEGRLDLNKLKELLGDVVETKGERYSFTWAGRNAAIKNRDHRSKETLIPVRNESEKFDATSNMVIEGDNLEVLKILQKSYEGKVKMIYIDPPYNTGNDFVYKDDFTDGLKNYLIQTGQMTEEGVTVTTNTERSGRFHSTWLTMMYPRLALARNFLSEDGVIFVSIDDNEIHNLRMIMNEIFGEENFISEIVWRRKRGRDNSARYFSKAHEYALVYGKNKENVKIAMLKMDENTRKAYRNPDDDPRGPYRLLGAWARGIQGGSKFAFKSKSGKAFSERTWLMNKESLTKLDEEGKLYFVGDNVYRKLFLSEHGGNIPETIWDDVSNVANASDEIKELFGALIFENPKPTPYIKRMIELVSERDSIILDFFAGSCTTAKAVLVQNSEDGGKRRFILVQLPEPLPQDSEARKFGCNTIADICKERLRRVINKLNSDGNSKAPDLGFKVFKLSNSNCFVWDEKLPKDQTTLAKHIESAAKGAVNVKDKEYLVYEILLREGFRLDSKIEQMKKGKNNFYKITDDGHELWMCFDERLDDHAVTELELHKDTKLVVFDFALTDTQKVNLGRKFRIETV